MLSSVCCHSIFLVTQKNRIYQIPKKFYYPPHHQTPTLEHLKKHRTAFSLWNDSFSLLASSIYIPYSNKTNSQSVIKQL